MLVLSRKSGERIHVGEDIVVEVKRVTGTRVTIAIEAPRDLRILRGELKEAATAFEPESPSDKASNQPADSEASNPQSISIASGDSFLLAHQRLDGTDPSNPAFA